MTAGVRHPLSVAHLSALHVAPPTLVRHAAAAGFDMVGALRLTPTSDGRGHPMLGDPAMRRATVTALRDTGLTVLDVEVVRLRPRTDVRAAEPLLEAGAELGARFLLTTVEDPDPPSRAESLGALPATGWRRAMACYRWPRSCEPRNPARRSALRYRTRGRSRTRRRGCFTWPAPVAGSPRSAEPPPSRRQGDLDYAAHPSALTRTKAHVSVVTLY